MKKSLLYLLPNITGKATIIAKTFYLLCTALLLALAGMAQVTPGQAVALNGVQQYCTMVENTDVTGDFTVEAWVRADPTTNRVMSIFSNRYNADFGFDMKLGISTTGNSTILADIGNGTAWLNTNASITYKIERSRWYHIAYTISGSANQYIIYVNGRQAGSGAITSGTSTPILFNSSHRNANIGKNESSQNEFFYGLMDEVRIYSRVLSATEMLGEAMGSMATTNRVKYYSFENASGNHFSSVLNSSDLLVYQGTGLFTGNSYAAALCQANAATAISYNSFTANWSAALSGTVTNYAVDVATDPDFNELVSSSYSVNVGTTSQSFINLLAGTQYYYRVRANNNEASVSGQGAYSNTISFTTLERATLGQAVAFNGTNQYCTMAQNTPVTGEFTVEAWVRGDATSDRIMSIFSSRYGADYSFDMKLGISATGNSSIQADIGNGTAWLNTAANISYKLDGSRWYHIAYTVSGSANQYIVYVNGRQAGSGTIVTSGTSNPVLFDNTHKNANIGQNQIGGSEFFVGLMDEVRIYNRVLTATEMLGEATGSTINATNRVKYFNFENARDGHFASLWDGTDFLVYQGSSVFTVNSYALNLCVANAASAIAPAGFTANWSAPAVGSVTNYLVDVSLLPDFSTKVINSKSINPNTTSLAVTGLLANTQYYYRVRANNAESSVDGQGAYSNTVGLTTSQQVDAGQAVALNGINQFCTMAQNTPVTSEFTVEAWVRPDANSNRVMNIFSSRYGAEFSFDMKLGINTIGNSTIQADIGNGTAWLNTVATTTYKIEKSHWYHIAYTVSGSANQYIVYVNGRQAASGAITSGTSTPVLFNNNHQNANLGQNQSTGDEFFLGLIDEVRIYSRALSATEMLAEATGSMSTTNRVKYFSFENATSNYFTSLWSGTDYLVYQGSSIFTAKSYALTLCQANDATSITNTSFIANWSAPVLGTVTNYLMDVATEPTFSAQIVTGKSITVGTTSTTITDLAPNKQYFYRVRANNTDAAFNEQGAYSNTASPTTLGAPTINYFTPDPQSYGGTVTITGTNFTPEAIVKFGGTDALSVVYNNANSLTATVGSGSSGNLTVTTLGGTATASGSFTYLPVSISSFTPTSGTFGNTVTITGNYFLPSSTVQFGGTPALSVVYNSATSLTATVGRGGSGLITVTTPGGTATSVSSFSYLTSIYLVDSAKTNTSATAVTLVNTAAWANACGNLQTALTAAAASGGQIWVKKGTYYPSAYPAGAYGGGGGQNGIINRDFSFALQNGVTIYGGFAGTESDTTARTASNKTILSGDIGTQGVIGDNCYHVLLSNGNDNTARIDGLTITGGNAVGTSYTLPSTIYQNAGGGMAIISSSPIITNCVFTNNTATLGCGLYNRSNSSPNITNCTFSANISSSSNGAGMYNDGSSPIITRCIFTGNSGNNGGAMYNNYSSPVIYSSVFNGNTAANNGGGIANSNSTPKYINSVFAANSSAKGGAAYNNASGAVFYNCTFSANSASNYGGCMVNTSYSGTYAANCIVWGNTAVTGAGIYDVDNSGGSTNITYSTIQGGYLGEGNISTNPLFVNAANPAGTDGVFGTVDDGLNIRVISPVRNIGISGPVSSYAVVGDITGTDRIQQYKVDFGAYEGGICQSFARLYVDSAMALPGNGSSWTTALTTLQQALDIANNCGDGTTTQIWVKKGTYYPASYPIYNYTGTTTAADYTFSLKNNLAIYGGFAGTETDTSQRVAGNTTILNGTNCYHILLSNQNNSTARIDMFTIKGGKANGAGTLLPSISRNSGGGIYLNASSPIISNCIFTSDTAVYGGGMYAGSHSIPVIYNCSFIGGTAQSGGGIHNDASSPQLSNCIFSANICTNEGGGIYNSTFASPVLDKCVFSGNNANFGGGISSSSSAPLVSNCTFSGNSASGGGGAISITGLSGVLTVSTSIFLKNTATNGSGGAILNYTSLNATKCRFDSNSASSGGGILTSGTSCNTEGCYFNANSANNAGGGIYANGSNSSQTNCVFYANTAKYVGGGMYNGAYFSTTNCTFYANVVTDSSGSGGGIYTTELTSPIVNSIFWGNIATTNSQIYNYTSNANIKYSLLQDGYVNTGNISADPQFINSALPAGADGIFGTTDDGLRLKPTSPAVDAGNSASVQADITTDAYGVPRIQGSKVDMGAYESADAPCNFYKPGSTLFVNSSIATSGNGSSWAASFKTLQEALLFSATCTNIAEIWVAGGTYYPAGSAANNASYRDSAFSIPRTGLKIYGGYNASTGLRNVATNPTILDGSGSSYHVLLAVNLPVTTDSLVLDGITIQGGNANGTGTKTYYGRNLQRNEGAAIQLYDNPSTSSKMMVRNCIFKNNVAIAQGAGFYNAISSPSISSCTFIDNTAPIGAGMFNFNNSSPIISNTIIAGNVSTGNGAGIYNNNNCSPTITNCTFSANNGASGVAVYNTNNSIPIINNSIVWGNISSNNIYLASGANAITVKNSLVQGSGGSTNWNVQGFTNGGGNIDIDPKFTTIAMAGNANSGNFRLLSCSPAIDAGSNTLAISSADRDGNARIYNASIVDVGAYEYAGSTPTSADLIAINGNVATLNIVAAQGNMLMATGSACRAVANILPDNTATQVTGSVSAQVWVETTQPVNYVKRHYEITPAANSNTATGRVTLYFTQQEFIDFNATTATKLPTNSSDATGIANLLIEKRPGTSSDGSGLPNKYAGTPTTINPADANIVWNSTAARWEVSFDVTGFSGFFVKTQSTVLPVTLLSFTANLTANKTTALQWNVAEQVGIKSYMVERSVDGSNFNQIGNVAANNITATSYTYTDASLPIISMLYYRLKIVGVDGTVTYSTIVSLKLGGSNPISIYPNPARNYVWLQGGNAGLIGTDVFVTDMQGRVISKIRMSNWLLQINTSSLADGVYLIKLEGNQTFKVVIER